MSSREKTIAILVSVLALFVLKLNLALGNGGPFMIKYPNGDPAAKGVLARLDPDLKPTRESRLRVVKEDLKVTFGRDRFPSWLPALGPSAAGGRQLSRAVGRWLDGLD